MNIRMFKNKTGESTDVYLYGEIGWDYTASDFANIFKEIKTENVNLYVNSPGGNVFEGFAIYNIMKRSGKKITAYVDGQALSIASLIIQAADEIYMAEAALFMIHNPWGAVKGEIKDMERVIQVLELIEAQMIEVYSNRTGISEVEIKGDQSCSHGAKGL